jgi:hypothetical protein
LLMFAIRSSIAVLLNFNLYSEGTFMADLTF